ncbi:hypothetical protein E2C06_24880 [Dankookia rubra]|uniref:Uncharacterized protein n=1 Tax=Dankookia rubra TaxID=1442381 RepID=A0A4R5QA20_9PROT|nr:hypothetical protein [Dankookia rubra]TDH59882.1 hypothetical protein E2C06_24880 [Dankookia rubra]
MATDINLLIRGQSNALLFTAFGAAASLEQQLEARVPGTDIHLLAEYDTDTSTMYSATGFLDWPRDGEQQGLLTFIGNQSADIRDNPTITLWMHNEYDGNTPDVTTDRWVAAVQADAALVRDALGQGAATTPYEFTYVDYPFTASGSPEAIQAGMARLSADPGFNARFDPGALQGLAMDGPGYPPNGHIGYWDSYAVAGRLADIMAGTVATLAGGAGVAGPGDSGPGNTGGGDPAGGGRVWDFNAVADSPKYAPVTLDWQAGDRIDLSDVALVGAERPAALHWAGIDPDGPVKAWGIWEWGDGSGTLRVDVDGDSSADMSITLRGAPLLAAGDFILG